MISPDRRSLESLDTIDTIDSLENLDAILPINAPVTKVKIIKEKNPEESLPIVDVSALLIENPSQEALDNVVETIRSACINWGFFYIVNHGVRRDLQQQVESLSRQFFSMPVEQKNDISFTKAGKSWRGYFSLGGEHTNKRPDLKEGINFGVDFALDDPRVVEGRPLHGPNLWPEQVPELKSALSEYMSTLEHLGQAIMRGVALSLNLPENYFRTNYLQQPAYRCITLNYPPNHDSKGEIKWGVGEHTDYGLLTILKQDMSGGLQVKSANDEWIEAVPVQNSFVVNIGDMLQTATNGLYVSTVHRVQNKYTGKDRFSCPFFLDPVWDAEIKPLPTSYTQLRENETKRVQSAKSSSYTGNYGAYATAKFSASFPGSK